RELAKLEAEAGNAERAVEDCDEGLRAATDRLAASAEAAAALQSQLRGAERRRDDATRALGDSELRLRDAIGSAQRAANKLAEPYRSRLGGIESDGFPTPEDLTALASGSATVDSLDRALRGLRVSEQNSGRLAAQLEAKQQALVRVGDLPQPETLAAEQDQL